MNRVWVLTFVLILSVSQLMAAEKETVQLDEVVVSATRYEEKVKSIPANVTVITDEDIANSNAQSITDLLRGEMGLHVNDIGANKRSVTVDLRGFGGTAALNTLVLVDGRRVNQADLSGVDWAQIPLDRVKKIEIIRGGQGSVLYGDNAAGGVINIITKRGDEMHAHAGTAAGSYDTYKGDVAFSNSTDYISYAINGSYLNSEGYRTNSDTEAKDLGFNISYFPHDRVNLNFSTGYHKDNTGLPGALKKSDFAGGLSRRDTINPKDFAEVEDYYFKGGPEIYFGDESFVKLDLSFRNRSSLTFASFVGGSFLGDTKIETKALSPQVVLKHEEGEVKNSLSLGYDFQDAEEHIINDSSFSGVAEYDLEKESYGYYIHDEINIMKTVLLSGGFRHDRAKFGFDPSTPDDLTLDEDLYSAAVNYNYGKQSYAYFSYSKSFRHPVLDELFSFIGNSISTNLMPQTSDNYELGLRQYFSDEVYAHINFFRMDTNDEILFNPGGGPFGFGANENLDGKTRRDGIEAAINARLTEWLSASGSYSYIDASIRGGQYQDSDMPNVPNHKGTLEIIVYPLEGLTVTLNGVYVGDRPFNSDFANSFNEQDNYTIVNSKIKYQWKQITAFLDLNNIADEEYSEFGTLSLFGTPVEEALYPSPEFNMLFGISVEL